MNWSAKRGKPVQSPFRHWHKILQPLTSKDTRKKLQIRAFLNFQLLKCGWKQLPSLGKEASIKHPWTDKYSRDEILFIIDSGKDSTLHPRMARPFARKEISSLQKIPALTICDYNFPRNVKNAFLKRDTSKSIPLLDAEEMLGIAIILFLDRCTRSQQSLIINLSTVVKFCRKLSGPTHEVVEVVEEKNPIVDTHKSQAYEARKDVGSRTSVAILAFSESSKPSLH
ncbi:hypothetical protein HAX54_025921 [Datura stramonium]|uniref:Uncharacterized protein n=1 Tax=Datura stramonium TaxID=4076 RepID=A0ABS8V316_DATST|nr:hypothetical protein [Datura stramonium]